MHLYKLRMELFAIVWYKKDSEKTINLYHFDVLFGIYIHW